MKTKAYHSDPKYCRSFIGRYMWPFHGRGMLELTKDKLTYNARVYRDGPFHLELAANQIHSVALGMLPQIVHPFPFYFVDVSFSGHDGAVQHIYLVPAPKEQHVPVIGIWKTYRTSMKWLAALRE